MLSTVGMIGIGYAAYAENMSLQAAMENELYKEQHKCLALNLYHEARSESVLGMKAVGWVTLNRVYSKRYPNTICDVVYQSNLDDEGNIVHNQCQFSWWCDGKSDKPKNKESWAFVQVIAHEVMQDYGITEDFTDGATMYHASYVNPYWIDSYERTVRIDTHIFYK
jgi:spore germination cell wall hydrolase CwlJ-like protein